MIPNTLNEGYIVLRDKFLKTRDFIRNHPYIAGIILVSLVCLFTPYYSVGYLGILIVSSRYLHPLKAFDSYFSNFIISLLLLCVSIMLAGIFAILFNTPVFAVYNIVIFIALALLVRRYQPVRVDSSRVITKIDLLLIGVSLIGPLLIVVSQMSYSPQVAIYKMVNGDGWDNAVHLGLLQLSEHFNSYSYPGSQTFYNDGEITNSYPQGWHLASTNIGSGFGGVNFDTSEVSVLRTLISYLVLILLWYVTAIYVFLKYVVNLASESTRKLGSLSLFISLGALSMLPVLFVLMPAVHQGFVNYMGIIPYLILFVAATIQFTQADAKGQKDLLAYLTLILPILAGITLIWTLPAPGLGLVLLCVLIMNKNTLKHLINYRAIPVVLGVVLVGVPILIYAYILLTSIGFGQVYVNTGYVSGFPRPELLLILVVVVCIGIRMKYMKLHIDQVLLILSPLMAYMLVLWILSYIKSGQIGYYQSKMLTLIAVIIMLISIPIIIRFIADRVFDKSRLRSVVKVALVSVGVISGIIIFSGNQLNLNSLKRLDWHDDKLIAQTIDWVYRNQSVGSGQLVVFGDNMSIKYNKSMLFNLVDFNVNAGFYTKSSIEDLSVDAYRCISPYGLFYVGNTAGYSKRKILERLDRCLASREEKGLSTTILSLDSNKSFFDTINTHDARIIYVKK